MSSQIAPRELTRSGRVHATVERMDAARERLERAAAALGAQVSRLEAREERHAEYLLRVPPDRLEALMDSAAALGSVDVRTVVVEDVTEQVVDVEARLAALRASRDRLRQLLDRSASVTDVVAVERELARVQAEIESLEARLTALRGHVNLSDLTVQLEERRVLGPLGVVAVGLGQVVGKLFVWR